MRALFLATLVFLAGCTALPGSEGLRVRCHTVDPLREWGAISGLGSDGDLLYAVHDHNRPVPQVLVLEPAADGMEIRRIVPLRGGTKKLDLEGVTKRPDGGYWAVSEGKGRKHPNALLAIAPDGEIQAQVTLPHGMEQHRTRAGLEGVAARGTGGDEIVAVAFQRRWKDDPPGLVKLGLYRPRSGQWRFFHYPLDHPKSGISALAFLPDGRLAVLERDNRPLFRARIKRIYAVRLPGTAGTVQKELVLDLLQWRSRLLQCGTNGKFEGMTFTGPHHLFLVPDDDGDASARILELRW